MSLLSNHSIALLVSILSSAPSLLAQQEVILHEGDNELPSYTAVIATFTPEHDCKVLIETADFYNVDYDGTSYAFSYVPSNNPPQVCEVDGVTAGTTVTLTSSFVMNPLVRITTFASGEVIPVEINSTVPAIGTADFWSHNGQLTVTFNKEVRITGAHLETAGTTAQVEIQQVTTAVTLNLSSTLNQLLHEGTLTQGEMFDVVIEGLRDANNADNLYGGDGRLVLTFMAPHPQYGLTSATVNGSELSTSTLNDYAFLSYYSPDSQDGLFCLEFESDVQSVGHAVLQMGSRDLIGQGKYYEDELPVTLEGNRVWVDARGVLRTLNILFPAVVEQEAEAGENVNEGLGEYDKEHITLRISNVKDQNGNYFRAEQAGNVGSYSYYMNYRELIETINLDGDNKMSGDEVVAGEEIRLWVGNSDVQFEGILISYVAELDEEESYELRNLIVSDYSVEPDPYEGIIVSFVMPLMPDVAVGQPVRVSLYNASSSDGMPHDLGIDFKAGEGDTAIEQIAEDRDFDHTGVWMLNGQRMNVKELTKGTPYIVNGRVTIAL